MGQKRRTCKGFFFWPSPSEHALTSIGGSLPSELSAGGSMSSVSSVSSCSSGFGSSPNSISVFS